MHHANVDADADLVLEFAKEGTGVPREIEFQHPNVDADADSVLEYAKDDADLEDSLRHIMEKKKDSTWVLTTIRDMIDKPSRKGTASLPAVSLPEVPEICEHLLQNKGCEKNHVDRFAEMLRNLRKKELARRKRGEPKRLQRKPRGHL